MRILALEPYYGGSHRAFLDGWMARSRHEWTLLDLPPFKWKWRMRHSALTFGEQAARLARAGRPWDVLFCSDMLNLAEFLGLAPGPLRALPAIVYFHENQLTYPVRVESERDYHFGYTNMTTALAATRVWFNSQFNRRSFLEALPRFLKRMPDYYPEDAVERIDERSEAQYPGVAQPAPRGERRPGPLRILWAARWEHDKNPEAFFDALARLEERNVAFRLSVIGEQFREAPEVFAQARRRFAGRIDRWGFQGTRLQYEEALLAADVFVSTAEHEFFGLSAVEAIAAGAVPLLPKRLAYPEILSECVASAAGAFFYSGGSDELADRLADLAAGVEDRARWAELVQPAVASVTRFLWPRRAAELDAALEDATAR